MRFTEQGALAAAAASEAKKGRKVAVRVVAGAGWNYGAVVCDEVGLVFALAGERNDVKLVLSRFVELVDGETVRCPVKACAREFVSAETLHMHAARKHSGKRAAPAVLDADPAALREHLARRDAAAQAAGRAVSQKVERESDRG